MRGDRRRPPARRLVGEPLEHEPRQRGLERSELGAERSVDDRVEHLGLVAQRRQRAQHVLLRRRVQLAQAPAGASRGSGRAPRSRCSSPRATAGRARRSRPRSARGSCAAAGGRSGPSARASPAARAGPARRRAGRGRSRPGRSRCGRWRSARRAARRAAPPPRSGARAPRPARCRPARRRGATCSGTPEPLAERDAVRLVGVGLGSAQPVVDVQRDDRARVADREVEQAGRVAPAARTAPRPAPDRITGRPPGTARWPRRSPSA